MAGLLTHTAFRGTTLLANGALHEVALAVKRATEADPTSAILIFEDATGKQIDVLLQGSEDEVVARLKPPSGGHGTAQEPRGRGRPKLGVTAREVTLLPRHWDWLNAQPGGASVTLRRLVDEARRKETEDNRAGRNAAYGFMSAIAGDFENFEEASRALFANDRQRFETLMSSWPQDVRMHAVRLAFGE